jgi:hypothetical protein
MPVVWQHNKSLLVTVSVRCRLSLLLKKQSDMLENNHSIAVKESVP